MKRLKKSKCSDKLFLQAKKIMPGGVSSPVRAFKAVGGHPVFISHAKGSNIYDVAGKKYIDYLCSWGSLILGHANIQIVAALRESLKNGTSFGACTEEEIILAKEIIKAVPSIEMVRFVNSGTEAVMSALRLARAYTEKSKIVKFEGCYHGHIDSLLVKAGSGKAAFGLPSSKGVTEAVIKDTLIARYNNLKDVENVFDRYSKEIAAVIVEPVAGNMGVVLPQDGFLEGLRKLTKENGSILIFDEIITGFRVSYGGAQELYQIKPDLTCLGKIIGGGLPVGVYGGRKEIMQLIAPDGPVYQAGTLSGNPLAMTAGMETLKILKKYNIYSKLEKLTAELTDGFTASAKDAGVDIRINKLGSMLTVFFTNQEVYDYKTAKNSDVKKYAGFFHSMLSKGIYLPPSQFEAMFVSLVHSKRDIEKSLDAAEISFKNLRRN